MVQKNGSLMNQNEEAGELEEIQEKLKGAISFPCCRKEKKMVYAGARGRVSDKCPRCGKTSLFDLEKMTSRRCKPVRFATS